MEQIAVLEIPFQFENIKDTIHPVVLIDDNETILVDCGYVGFLPYIETALVHNGIDPQSLTKVVITHHDHDHMGALYDLKEKYPWIQVIASELDADYVSGKQKSLRLLQAETTQNHLPQGQKEFGKQFIQLLQSVKPVPVDRTVRNDQVLNWCGGCKVVDTPGHMPGHISLYLPTHRCVITGDAMALEHGKPVLANPQFALDMQAAVDSLEKLLQLDAERFICYHGGIYQAPCGH